MLRHLIMTIVIASTACVAPGQAPTTSSLTRIKAAVSGGHDLDPRDGGRPVFLIAGALGVSPDVFREAFSRVRPARGSHPSCAQVHQNKAVLMQALGRYGITNDRLDTVSNYYRYRREQGEMWPTRPAVIYARLRDGRITTFEIEDGGSGYTSPPTLSFPAAAAPPLKVEIGVSREFEKNGSVTSVTLPDPARPN